VSDIACKSKWQLCNLLAFGPIFFAMLSLLFGNEPLGVLPTHRQNSFAILMHFPFQIE
jgi:hypothetical protein